MLPYVLQLCSFQIVFAFDEYFSLRSILGPLSYMLPIVRINVKNFFLHTIILFEARLQEEDQPTC